MGTDDPDLRSDVERAAPGAVEEAGNLTAPFAAALLSQLDRETTNLVCSPLSAQIVLSMVAAGAGGSTRAQMEDVLGADVRTLGETANTLAQHLAAMGEKERANNGSDGPEPPRASLVNAVWAADGLEPTQAFLDALATWFDTGIYTADFTDATGREAACERINAVVEHATEGLITDLVAPDALTEQTVMVLVNALHLKTAWLKPLNPDEAVDFTTSDGETVRPEMLTGEVPGWYEDEHCTASALRGTGGQLALALVRPTGEPHEVLETWAADGQRLGAVLRGIEGSADVTTTVTTPGFDIDWDGELTDPLKQLGMTEVFDPGTADLSGISTDRDLAVTMVFQKAVITVDADGMEAAAATAVSVGTTAYVPQETKELVLDRPFLFVAYDTASCTPLVLGWIGDPTQTR